MGPAGRPHPTRNSSTPRSYRRSIRFRSPACSFDDKVGSRPSSARASVRNGWKFKRVCDIYPYTIFRQYFYDGVFKRVIINSQAS